jgi:hypothetical protein
MEGILDILGAGGLGMVGKIGQDMSLGGGQIHGGDRFGNGLIRVKMQVFQLRAEMLMHADPS